MDLERILGLDSASLRARTERTTEAIYDEWKALAPNASYADALTLEVVSDTKGQVILEGPSVFLERGSTGGRDMREGLLNSPKAHRSKTGSRYLAIPMRDGLRTASDNGSPWMSKPKTGAGAIVKVMAMVPALASQYWIARST